MHDVLNEVLKLFSCVEASGIKIVGTETETYISCVEDSSMLVAISVALKKPIAEFAGRWAIPHREVLQKYLGHEPYRKTPILIERMERVVSNEDKERVRMEVPVSAVFRDGKGGLAKFHFSNSDSIGGANLHKGRCSLEFDPDKDRVKEFLKLVSIFHAPDCKTVRPVFEEGNMKIAFGQEGATTNHGVMVFAEGVDGVGLRSELNWDSQRLATLLKTVLDKSFKIGITDKYMQISFETDHGDYRIWLRPGTK